MEDASLRRPSRPLTGQTQRSSSRTGKRPRDCVPALLIRRLVDAESGPGVAVLVLTDARTGSAVLRAVPESPQQSAVCRRRVELWWSVKRWVHAGCPGPHHRPAHDALLGRRDRRGGARGDKQDLGATPRGAGGGH